MKTFVSDLDQTLIFSKQHIDEEVQSVQCVEYVEGAPLSFMLDDTISSLKKLAVSHEFIPITTRTKSQYERIELPVIPTYAVVANGATILVDGLVDKHWEKVINNRLKSCSELKVIKKYIAPLLKKKGVLRIKDADHLFLYMITDTKLFDSSTLNDYKIHLEECGWRIYNQGKKIYFIPRVITKGSALSYLKSLNDFKSIVASGDSSLDHSMKEPCDYFIVPGHSQLTGDYKCQATGIDSSLETIKKASSFLSSKN